MMYIIMIVAAIFGVSSGVSIVKISAGMQLRQAERAAEEYYLERHADDLIHTIKFTKDVEIYRTICKEHGTWELVVFLDRNHTAHMLLDRRWHKQIGNSVPYWSCWWKIELKHLLPEDRAMVIELVLSSDKT